MEAEFLSENIAEPLGKVIKKDGCIAVVCGAGLLLLNKVQLAGRKAVKIADFVNGQRDFVGTVLL